MSKLTSWLVSGMLVVLSTTGFTANAKQITIEHPLGKTTLTQSPKRVVVLGMDTLDVLDKLNIEPIGVVKAPMPDYLSKYQDDKYQAVGSLFEPDFEKIFSLKPDLILVSNRSSPKYAELSKIAPSVVFMADAKDYWGTTQAQWQMIGKIFDKQAEVDAIIGKMQKQIDDIRSKTFGSQYTALTVMTNGGNISAFGAQSRYRAIYDMFGFSEAGKSTKSSRHGEVISFEYIAKVNPNFMLVLDRDHAIGKSSPSAKEKFDNALINKLDVFKNNRIAFLNSQAWYISASGIHATQIMIDDLASIVE